MRVHLILDLESSQTTDQEISVGYPKARPTFARVTEEFENELEHNTLEVDGQVYGVKVMGVGKTAREVDESLKMRSQYR